MWINGVWSSPTNALPTTTIQNVSMVGWTPEMYAGMKCDGCGFGYLINAVNPLHPHNPEACAAYKRGFADGQSAASRSVDRGA